MATAVEHTHLVARSYHRDIKPANFLIDDDDNLILSDWEQSDAPATTLAPEADGTWDVEEMEYGPVLKYIKYEGAERQNTNDDLGGGHSWNLWNVFPIWQTQHPKALELAEVFSLGRSMWMLLRQPNLDFDDIEHPDDLVTDWTGAGHIPVDWTAMVDRCMSEDPNKRPQISSLTKFWVAAVQYPTPKTDIWTSLINKLSWRGLRVLWQVHSSSSPST